MFLKDAFFSLFLKTIFRFCACFVVSKILSPNVRVDEDMSHNSVVDFSLAFSLNGHTTFTKGSMCCRFRGLCVFRRCSV